jgi:signal transduction histidine kinase
MSEKINEIETAVDTSRQKRDELKKKLQEALEIRNTNPKESLDLVRQIRRRAKQLNFINEEAEAYHVEALCYELMSDFKQAYLKAEKAKELFVLTGNTLEEAKVLSLMANIYLQLGQYDSALDYNVRSLTIYESLNYAKGVGSALNNIGLSYLHLGDYRKARHYFEKALAFREKHNLKKGMAYTLNNLASICEKEKDYEQATRLQCQSLEIMRELKDKRGEAAVLCNRSKVCAALGEFHRAVELQRQSLEIERELGNIVGEVESLFELGKIYSKPTFEQADDQKAIAYWQEALSKAEQVGEKKISYMIHHALSEMYVKHRNFEAAYQHYRQYSELRESVISNDVYQKAQGFELKMIELEDRKALTYYKLLSDELSLLNFSLSRAIELKSELIGVVTHDLSNPLQAIIGYAQLANAKSGNAEQVLKYTTQIEQVANQMQAIIAHWLKVAADESIMRNAGKKEVNLNAVIKHVIDTMRIFVEKKSQEIVLNEQASASVLADPQLLYEVFENLISNAIKYSLMEKTISVTITSDKDTATVSVKDEGQGLSADDMKKLFGKFQTLSSRPTMGERSTGMGLFITKQIVELHQGKIWAESEGKDKGTTFFVQLPLCPTHTHQ